DPMPGMGLSAGVCALEGFIIVTWLRTHTTPPYLGPFLLLFAVRGVIDNILVDTNMQTAGHIGGYFAGVFLGSAFVQPDAHLPIKIGRQVEIAGEIAAMVLIATCIGVSFNLSGAAWAQW